MSRHDWIEYNRLFNERVEEWLNNGYGSCLLKKEKNTTILSNAIKFFDGNRYELDEWVIMPNHAHLLIRPKEGFHLSHILHGMKSFTAHEINKAEDRTGVLWMPESFDHIVRNQASLEAFRDYIWDNPRKAGIVAPAASKIL